MKTKRNIKILFENGLKFSTIKNLTPNQVKVLVERFTKKDEVEEAVTTTQKSGFETKITPGSTANLKFPSGTQFSVNPAEGITAMSPKPPVGTGETAEGEMSEDSQELDEKFASKAQQKLFFVKCGNGKTKEQKKWCKLRDEFARSTTKKDYKKMPEKLHPEKTVPVKKRKRKSIKEEEYERFLEKKIVSLVEKHIDPEMTKGDLIQTIMEKVNKSKNFMLKNPKKNTMFQTKGRMTKPIGNLYSISGEMKEDTKEKERTITRPDTDRGKKRRNPHRDPNPDVYEKPKADQKEKERTITRPDTDRGKKRRNPHRDPNPDVYEKPKAEKQKNQFISIISSILNNN